MVLGFLRKKEDSSLPPGGPAMGPPVEEVLGLQQQGMTNNQIVQALQRQGHDLTSIMDALAQAEARRGIDQFSPTSLPPPDAPPRPTAQELQGQSQGSGSPGDYGVSQASVEEIAESIVQEKWQDLTRELGKITEWRDRTDSRLDKLEQSVTDIKSNLESLHRAILGKISDYDKNLLYVGTEIKAMEKVFQKILPSLTESVNELSRIAGKSKEGGPQH